MKYLFLTMRDRAANCYGQPFFTGSVGLAIRSFADVINDPNSKDMVSRHPEDFDLFELGTFDDEDATFQLLDRPRQVAVGKDLVRPRTP